MENLITEIIFKLLFFKQKTFFPPLIQEIADQNKKVIHFLINEDEKLFQKTKEEYEKEIAKNSYIPDSGIVYFYKEKISSLNLSREKFPPTSFKYFFPGPTTTDYRTKKAILEDYSTPIYFIQHIHKKIGDFNSRVFYSSYHFIQKARLILIKYLYAINWAGIEKHDTKSFADDAVESNRIDILKFFLNKGLIPDPGYWRDIFFYGRFSLPILAKFEEEKGNILPMDEETRTEWEEIKKDIKKNPDWYLP